MNEFVFKHISGEVKEFSNVVYISNRDDHFMIITRDNNYPEFLNNDQWELWRFS